MIISSKQIREIANCKNREIKKDSVRCKLLNKTIYLKNCRDCKHKSNVSIDKFIQEKKFENRGNKIALFQLKYNK